MSLLAVQLLRGLTGLTRRLPVQRAQMHSKPPREELGTMVVWILLASVRPASRSNYSPAQPRRPGLCTNKAFLDHEFGAGCLWTIMGSWGESCHGSPGVQVPPFQQMPDSQAGPGKGRQALIFGPP